MVCRGSIISIKLAHDQLETALHLFSSSNFKQTCLFCTAKFQLLLAQSCRYCAYLCVCVSHRTQTTMSLCADLTWPHGTAWWRHIVAQMGTFCAGHILRDPPVRVWTTALINQKRLLPKENCTVSTQWQEATTYLKPSILSINLSVNSVNSNRKWNQYLMLMIEIRLFISI